MALLYEPHRLPYHMEHALLYLAGNAKRAHPDRDCKTRRLKPALEYVSWGLRTNLWVGISDYAQESIGDIVYLDLPGLGASIATGEACGRVEFAKVVNDLTTPLHGDVVENNPAIGEGARWPLPIPSVMAGCWWSAPTAACLTE